MKSSLPIYLPLQKILKDILQVTRNPTVLSQEGMEHSGNITYVGRIMYVDVYDF